MNVEQLNEVEATQANLILAIDKVFTLSFEDQKQIFGEIGQTIGKRLQIQVDALDTGVLERA